MDKDHFFRDVNSGLQVHKKSEVNPKDFEYNYVDLSTSEKLENNVVATIHYEIPQTTIKYIPTGVEVVYSAAKDANGNPVNDAYGRFLEDWKTMKFGN